MFSSVGSCVVNPVRNLFLKAFLALFGWLTWLPPWLGLGSYVPFSRPFGRNGLFLVKIQLGTSCLMLW